MKPIDYAKRYEKIKELAHHFWMSEGCQANKDQLYWNHAEWIYFEQYAIWEQVTIQEFEVKE